MNENNLATEAVDTCDKALQRKDVLLSSLFFFQRCIEFLKLGLPILESFANPFQHRKKCGTPLNIGTRLILQ